jgi:hypothetical protein
MFVLKAYLVRIYIGMAGAAAAAVVMLAEQDAGAYNQHIDNVGRAGRRSACQL